MKRITLTCANGKGTPTIVNVAHILNILDWAPTNNYGECSTICFDHKTIGVKETREQILALIDAEERREMLFEMTKAALMGIWANSNLATDTDADLSVCAVAQATATMNMLAALDAEKGGGE